MFDEFDTATHTGLHLEKINNSRNPGFGQSASTSSGAASCWLALESGYVYTLLKVLPHDDAYDWAQRSNISVNKATGGIETRDEAALQEALPEMEKTAKAADTLLFATVTSSGVIRSRNWASALADRTTEGYAVTPSAM